MKNFHIWGEALKRENDSFIKHTFTKHCTQDKWVELVWWDSMESAKVALEKMPITIEFQQYCSILEDEDSEIIYLEQKN